MRKESLEQAIEMMPEGWKEAARTTKALVRSRNIKTPEELLRLIFLYQTSGESYGLTSVLTQISEDQIGLNKTAVQKRIVNSAEWLRWICENMCYQEGFLTTPPKWLSDYRVCLVDASDYARQGSNHSDFRLHYMMDLFTLNAVEMHFTEASEGEKLTRYSSIQKGDIVVADRAYCTIQSIQYVLENNADFVLRMRSNSFNLYTEDGTKYDLTEDLKDWSPMKRKEYHLFYKKGKELVPIRICAIGKTKKDIEKSNRKTKEANHKRKDPSRLQSIWNQYIVVAASLPDEISADRILELYRMRWQIELVFKRFKSIFGGREFTVRKENAVKAWFYGKLLVAIVCETIVKQGRFSPEQEKIL